jgi:anti-anti-sigma factor
MESERRFEADHRSHHSAGEWPRPLTAVPSAADDRRSEEAYMAADPSDETISGLEIEAGQEGDEYVLRLIGVLDAASCRTFKEALDQAERSAAQMILVDVNRLVFIDSSGLQAILAAKRRSDTDSNRLRLTRGTGHVADMFRLTALDQVLPFVGTPS